MFVLLPENDARVLNAGRRQVDVVGVVGAEDVAETGGACKMIGVCITEKAQVADSHCIDAAPL